MKHFLASFFAFIIMMNLTGCGKSGEGALTIASENIAVTEQEKISATKIVSALTGGGLLGETWTKADLNSPQNELVAYEQLTGFYCMMFPESSSQIPAAEYEDCLRDYLGIEPENTRLLSEYHADKNCYMIPVDVSVDMIHQQIEKYLRIDGIQWENDQIKVSYRILWGDMASYGDGSDSAFEGFVSLENVEGTLQVQSVTITEDHSDKYDS